MGPWHQDQQDQGHMGPWHQGQGQDHGENRTNKAYNANITLISVQLFAFVK